MERSPQESSRSGGVPSTVKRRTSVLGAVSWTGSTVEITESFEATSRVTSSPSVVKGVSDSGRITLLPAIQQAYEKHVSSSLSKRHLFVKTHLQDFFVLSCSLLIGTKRHSYDKHRRQRQHCESRASRSTTQSRVVHPTRHVEILLRNTYQAWLVP